MAQNTGRIKQWNTNERIAFSVLPQCDFSNQYHACMTWTL